MFDYKMGEKTAGAPDVDFSDAREMQPYLNAPRGMYVGAPGKHGYLRMGFELADSGKCIMRDLERRAPLIVQQELYFDENWPQLPCVYILSSGGANIDGDRYQQEISLAKDAFAWISTGAATKLSVMERNYSAMRQIINLDEGSYLEYMPEPVIPCRHTRFISDTAVTIHPTATLFYSEIYMGGRKYYGEGEMYEYDIMSVCCRARRPDGKELFREKFIIDPARRLDPRQLGLMGAYDVFATVLVLTPADMAEKIYDNTPAFIDREKHIAAGITRLPSGAGLLYKVVGMETGPVKELVREFSSTVRQTVKGIPAPKEFPWRLGHP